MLFGKYVNRFYYKYFWFFFFGVAALIAVNYFQLLIPEIFGTIIDKLNDGSLLNDPSLVNGLLFEMAGIALIMFTGRFLWRYCVYGAGIRIEADMRDMMFIHSIQLSTGFYKEHKTGALMALYTNDLTTIREIFGRGTIMLIDFVFLGSMTLVKMFILNYKLTLVCLIPSLFLAVAYFTIGRKMEKSFKIRQKAYEDMSDFTQENISGISVIKAFVKEKEEARAFTKINDDNYKKNMSFIKLYMSFNVILLLLLNLIISIILALGSYFSINDPTVFSSGDVLVFVSYYNTLTWPMMAIGELINLRSQAKASLDRVSELLDTKPEIVDYNPIQSNIKGEIIFNDLTFAYPDEPNLNVLSNVTFKINKGEMVGILGKTGSGKSTLVDLLLRLYNLKDNQILLDGNDIMKLSFKNVREAIGYVPQENFLFSDTVRNNIAFACEEVDEEMIVKSAILSDVHENIIEFTDGYQTVLGERGVTLSGGQKQRVSIARALIKNPPIMIFDDSVSAVDTKTEEKILSNLREIRKGKTTIMVSHRISTVKNLDKIILLDKGQVVGIGSHDELYATNELYQEMVNLQQLEKEVNS